MGEIAVLVFSLWRIRVGSFDSRQNRGETEKEEKKGQEYLESQVL